MKNLNEMSKLADKSGLVIVTGHSDDIIYFYGAIYDEADCFDGGTIYFDKTGKHISSTHEYGLNNSITAIWCGQIQGESVDDLWDSLTDDGERICWTFKTDIPHETFMIYDEGEPFCRGIILSMEALV